MKDKFHEVSLPRVIRTLGEYCSHDCDGLSTIPNPEEPTQYECHFFPNECMKWKDDDQNPLLVWRCKGCLEICPDER